VLLSDAAIGALIAPPMTVFGGTGCERRTHLARRSEAVRGKKGRHEGTGFDHRPSIGRRMSADGGRTTAATVATWGGSARIFLASSAAA
jgi:hypothetical protein